MVIFLGPFGTSGQSISQQQDLSPYFGNKPYPKLCHQIKDGVVIGGILIFLSITNNGCW